MSRASGAEEAKIPGRHECCAGIAMGGGSKGGTHGGGSLASRRRPGTFLGGWAGGRGIRQENNTGPRVCRGGTAGAPCTQRARARRLPIYVATQQGCACWARGRQPRGRPMHPGQSAFEAHRRQRGHSWGPPCPVLGSRRQLARKQGSSAVSGSCGQRERGVRVNPPHWSLGRLQLRGERGWRRRAGQARAVPCGPSARRRGMHTRQGGRCPPRGGARAQRCRRAGVCLVPWRSAGQGRRFVVVRQLGRRGGAGDSGEGAAALARGARGRSSGIQCGQRQRAESANAGWVSRRGLGVYRWGAAKKGGRARRRASKAGWCLGVPAPASLPARRGSRARCGRARGLPNQPAIREKNISIQFFACVLPLKAMPISEKQKAHNHKRSEHQQQP